MGNSLYCFSQRKNVDLILKSDLNIINIKNIIDNTKRDSSCLNNSNNKTTISSPIYEKRDIIINPIPEIVIIRHKINKKKENY